MDDDGRVIDASEYKNIGWGYVKENKAKWATGEIDIKTIQSYFDEFVRLKKELMQPEAKAPAKHLRPRTTEGVNPQTTEGRTTEGVRVLQQKQ